MGDATPIRSALRSAPPVTAAQVVDPADPLNTARLFVRDEYSHEGHRSLHWLQGAYHLWEDGRYHEIPADPITASAWHWLERKSVTPTRRIVSELLEALKAVCSIDHSTTAPCWLDGDHPARHVAPELLAALPNGLMDLASRELYPPSPLFFSHHALGVEYVPEASEPTEFLAFLHSVYEDDPESVYALQEFVGYLLTSDTRQQKALLLVGPKRGGKGTIARVIRALVGADQVAGPTLSSLAGNFGLEPLLHRSVAIIGDARISGRTEWAVVAERILSVTGEDVISVDRKFRPGWTGQLGARFVILTNELPRLSDASGALASRFIVLTSQASFYGREDHGLAARLLQELPAIFRWALDGLERLLDRGRFVQPASAGEAIQELEDMASPVSAFVREACEFGQGDGFRIVKAHLFESWRTWCAEHGYRPGAEATFARDLRAAFPAIATYRPRDGDRTRMWSGIRFQPRDRHE